MPDDDNASPNIKVPGERNLTVGRRMHRFVPVGVGKRLILIEVASSMVGRFTGTGIMIMVAEWIGISPASRVH